MKTKILSFLFVAFTLTFGIAQQVLIEDFSTSSTFTTAGFEGLGSAAIVADPVSGGTRGNGFQLNSVSTGQGWQGAEVVLSTKKVKLTTDKTMKVDVYSTQAFTMLVKVETGGPASATSAAYTTPGVWQTLTFNFSVPYDGTAAANGEYSKVVFFGNWKATNDGWNTPPANFTFHVDNITAEQGAASTLPTVAAPTPPARPVADVKSIFSNAYTNVTVDEWGPNWGAASTTITDSPIAGNATKLITVDAGKVFAGINFAGSKFDATAFTHFHMDLYFDGTVQAGLVLSSKLSNHSGAGGETNAIENTQTTFTPGQWVSLDLPLSSFTIAGGGSAARDAIAQVALSYARADNNTTFKLYIDNIYFHKNTVLGVNEVSKKNTFNVYPNPVRAGENITFSSEVKSVEIYNLEGKKVLNSNSQTVSSQGLSQGIYIVRATDENNAVQNTKLIVK